MELRIRKIGNSYGVILPRELLNALGVNEGDVLRAYTSRDTVRLVHEDTEFADWAEALREGIIRYNNTLRELEE